MTALKCEKSGVDANLAGFITSYADSNALTALLPLACTSTVGILSFSGEFIVRQSAPNASGQVWVMKILAISILTSGRFLEPIGTIFVNQYPDYHYRHPETQDHPL